MARGVNKVILIGNLGDEPTFKQTSTGTAVANISMVTNEVRRSMDTQQTTEFAEWHRVVMWGKLAEIAHQWLHKGSQIYVEGKLRTRSYTDKQGVKRNVTEIVADEMQMLGSKNSSYQNDSYPPAERSQPTSSNPYGQQTYTPTAQSNPYGTSPQFGGTAVPPQSDPNRVNTQQTFTTGGGYNPTRTPDNPMPQVQHEPGIYGGDQTSTVDGAVNDDDLPF